MNIGGPLVLAGCGKMGGALLDGWLARGVAAARISVIEPYAGAITRFTDAGVTVVGAAKDIATDLAPAIVVLAVKPQQMDALLPEIAGFMRPETLCLSIAAGTTIAVFERHLGPQTPIVRAMPNTPAAVGRGMTVLCATSHVSAAQREVAGALLSAVGEIAWVEEESLLDPVTAVSGGGPAYVFLLIECLAEAGVAAGLPEDLALRLARNTVAGAGELVHQSSDPASKLRENVTSPGGTTLEALKVLMAPDGLQPLMTRAIAAATRRSQELAS